MYSEWSAFFDYICSYYNSEVLNLLKNTKYKSICEELYKQEKLLLSKPTEDNINLYNEAVEKKTACYYEQAAVVALKHFVGLIRETGII